jgi:hypothetical protein
MSGIAIEHSSICPSVRHGFEEMGDDGRLAYRLLLVTEGMPQGQPVPFPFQRYADAERAAKSLCEAIVENKVPAEWDALRKFLAETLAW